MESGPIFTLRSACIAAALAVSLPCQAADAPAGVAAFRITAPNGIESLLFGSLHVAADGLLQPAPSVLNGSKRLVVEGIPTGKAAAVIGEMIPRADEIFKSTGTYPRAPWTQSLSAAELTGIEAAARCHGFADNRASKVLAYKRSDMAAFLTAIPCSTDLRASGRDKLLMEDATKANIPIATLETEEQEERQRLAIPESVNVHGIKKILTLDLPTLYRQMVDAFNEGDFDRVVHIADDSAASPEEAALITDLMVAQRNQMWRASLERLIEQPGTVVVVGAGHLPGDHGLLAILTRDGFKVRPIRVPAIPG